MGYYTPKTLSDALLILQEGDAKIISGCTDFFPALGQGPAPGKLLDLTGVPELRAISSTQTGWRIGASATWNDVIKADFPPAFDGLKAAAQDVGSVQIQNAASVVGNLCNASPAADGVPPLLTLGATLKLQSHNGARQVPLSDFITGVRSIDLRPNELVVAIDIPALPDTAYGHFLKLGSRKYLVISIAMVSVLMSVDTAGRIDMARVAVGACSAVAQRLDGLEADLIGQTAADLDLRHDLWAPHMSQLSPIDDVRGSAAFRYEVAAELCKRAVMAALRTATNG